MKRINLFVLLIVLISFVVGLWLYPTLPDPMASHWNVKGEVDGYMPKFWATFMLPGLVVFLYLMFLIIPKIDPLKSNIEKFKKYYWNFALIIILFMTYIHFLSLSWNLGWQFNMGLAFGPALIILFYYSGVLIGQAQRNWFVGIRTPWTLSSERVWQKTHQLGARLFKLIALIILIGLFFKDYLFWFVLGPVLGVTLYLFIYSYLEYQKEKQGN